MVSIELRLKKTVVELGGGFGSIVEDEPEQDKNQDIEKVALPPIEHVETHGDVVEVDFPADPIHPSSWLSPPPTPQRRSRVLLFSPLSAPRP